MNENAKYYIAKNDALFGKIFHEINTNHCMVQSIDQYSYDLCSGVCEMAHLIPKSNFLYRWDFELVIPLCSNHHRLSTVISDHKAPEVFNDFLKEHLPFLWTIIDKQKFAINKKSLLPFTFKGVFLELSAIDQGKKEIDKSQLIYTFDMSAGGIFDLTPKYDEIQR